MKVKKEAGKHGRSRRGHRQSEHAKLTGRTMTRGGCLAVRGGGGGRWGGKDYAIGGAEERRKIMRRYRAKGGDTQADVWEGKSKGRGEGERRNG